MYNKINPLLMDNKMRYFLKLKKICKSFLLSFFLTTNIINAENIDNILQEYNQKNDLSQKTIDENKGHLVLFTREKLEKYACQNT